MTYVKKRVQPRLKLLRSLVTTKYGADQDILIRTFTSLVVATIEFGSAAYGSARQKVLDHLQTIFNESLRIALGAFRTTRTTNLLNKAGVMDLQMRRKIKIATTALKILGLGNHPLKQEI